MGTISIRLNDNLNKELTDWLEDMDETKTSFIKRAVKTQLKLDKKIKIATEEIYQEEFIKTVENYEERKSNGSLEMISSDDFWGQLNS